MGDPQAFNPTHAVLGEPRTMIVIRRKTPPFTLGLAYGSVALSHPTLLAANQSFRVSRFRAAHLIGRLDAVYVGKS